MDEVVRAILLGTVQALTEFLPVSSSAHLALLGPLLGNHEESLTLDVGLHAGTAAAVLVFFGRDWAQITRRGLADLWQHGAAVSRWSSPGLGVLIAIGTLPAVMVGGLFGNVIEERLREPAMIAVMLLLGAVAMAVADRWGRTDRGLGDVTLRDSLVIGFSQAVALIPGVSRSGITITAGRGLGLERSAAVRFSFLLSMPVILGAVARQGVDAIGSADVEWRVIGIGATTAFLLGLLAIRFLLAFVATRTLMPFVWYRIGLAAVILVAAFV